MKILFCGYRNPKFVNTTVYREKALRELGHEVVFFNDRDFMVPGRMAKAFPYLAGLDVKMLNRRLAGAARREKPDLLIVTGGQGIFPETVQEIKKTGAGAVLRTTDPPVIHDKPTAVPRDFRAVVKAAPAYDHVFCAGTEAVRIMRDSGIEKVTWLPYSCDPDHHRPVELGRDDLAKYARDAVFVGAFYPNRARVLEAVSDMDIGVWGPNWGRLEKGSPLRCKAFEARMNYDEWVKIYSAAAIVMVIHFDDGKTACNQASPKLFEALACGCFVLVDGQLDARTLFRDGEQLVFFKDGRDLREKALYYLDHPELRAEIAAKGRREVLEKHTYRHRMEELISVWSRGR